ncbi:MAG: hypothetical protein K2X55_13035 [Burkholderiaceae bacterium]|nr:hypothetical protein [Burkholderiaceae bacterium]
MYTVHGTANPVGPFAQSVALREALAHAGIRNGLLPLPGANDGQFSALQVRLAWEAACWFLGR